MTATRTTWTETGTIGPTMRLPLHRPAPSRSPQPDAPQHTREPLMTVKDVADACRLSESAVRRAIYDGELQACKLRNRLRITLEDYDAWITAQRQPPHRAPAPPALQTRPARRAKAGTFRARVQAAAEQTVSS